MIGFKQPKNAIKSLDALKPGFHIYSNKVVADNFIFLLYQSLK